MIKLEIIDSSKGDLFFTCGSLTCINLNSYFKNLNNIKIREIDKPFIADLKELNLCNFATLCYRLGISYTTFDALELIQKIIDLLRLFNSNIKLVQYGVDNFMEVDCEPLETLVIYDKVIKINKMLRDNLTLVGFTDTQIANLYLKYKDLKQIVPKDLLEKIPLSSELTNMTYKCIGELLID